MKVIVKLIGPLIYEAGFSEKVVEFPGTMAAGDLPVFVGVDGKRPVIITRNGRAVAPGDRLAEGDRVVVSHIYSGG
jgi:sulfur carrier protein ThiS